MNNNYQQGYGGMTETIDEYIVSAIIGYYRCGVSLLEIHLITGLSQYLIQMLISNYNNNVYE